MFVVELSARKDAERGGKPAFGVFFVQYPQGRLCKGGFTFGVLCRKDPQSRYGW